MSEEFRVCNRVLVYLGHKCQNMIIITGMSWTTDRKCLKRNMYVAEKPGPDVANPGLTRYFEDTVLFGISTLCRARTLFGGFRLDSIWYAL